MIALVYFPCCSPNGLNAFTFSIPVPLKFDIQFSHFPLGRKEEIDPRSRLDLIPESTMKVNTATFFSLFFKYKHHMAI